MTSKTMTSPQIVFSLLIVTSCLTTLRAQNIFDCPDVWQSSGLFCYKFVGDTPLKVDDAAAECSYDGAGLLYVDSVEENTFIRNWLETNDPFQRTWLTSGHGVTGDREVGEGETPFFWGATSQIVHSALQFWLPGQPPTEYDLATAVIAYSFGETGYGWSLVNQGDVHPYICKIPQGEAYRIVQTSRDFDYGLDVEDVNALDRGPHFVLTPHSVVVVSETGEQAFLECLADAKPEPVYKWFRGDNFEEEVTSETDSRYTLTNGRLFIQMPDEISDASDYRCQVSNKYGTIVSSSVAITFGYLGEFSNVQNAPVRANAYDGVAVECSQIAFRPAVRYQWLKDTAQFIRTDFQAYIFISNNGKLYFSEVTRSDEGEYRCIAVLTGVNQYTIGTTQPPTRTSLPIPLLVQDQSPKADWGPEIQNDFPAVFPQPPLRGHDVRLECFAYGSSTTPFYYSWRREGLPIPASAIFEDHNRVMIIRNAQLEDSGTYTCDVMRSSNARDTRSIYLSLAAHPYFVAPLQDQHADVGSQLTWRCDARGSPPPSYLWYKNGQQLTSDPDTRVVVARNVLTITNLQAELHDGMYQCGAFNSHGAEMSNAQLRVLAFAPTFAKHPLPPQVTGPIGGRLTIVCNPEGAPLPQITWLRNGGALVTGGGSRLSQLANGNLIISDLQQGDAGQYTCQAENEFGQASSSTVLNIACKEDRCTLEEASRLTRQQMRAAFVDGVRVKDKIVRVKWIISSDWKALSLLKGVNSANANHFCLWCLCTKREITDFTKTWKTERTKQQQQTCLLPDTEESFGYQAEDMFDWVPYTWVVPDELHLQMRNTNKLLNQVVVWAVDQGRQEDLLEEMKRLVIDFRFFEEEGDDGKGRIKKWTQLTGDDLKKTLKRLDIIKVLEPGPRHVKNLYLLPRDVLKRALLNRTGQDVPTSAKKNIIVDRLQQLMTTDEQRELVASHPRRRSRILAPGFSPEQTPSAQMALDPAGVRELWDEFGELMEAMTAVPGSVNALTPSAFQARARGWAEKFRERTFHEDVIPYIHCLVYHVPEALEKLSYIKDVGIAQVERKNYDQHLQFFQGTSRQGGAARKKVTQQILERENRLLYYRRYPNGEQLSASKGSETVTRLE